ncbi:hypothetical protein [Rummeliibacillus sp. POC4]|uniref:hypothetical protein n=1 Tax=Rummeliibacillus sp. POC4 TaxID=2305899 RepID=UPI000E66036A|nr:hypothetical protein [Rummeliibacillus sp. POC4]RIJ63792.1 hypothetical protein D1606_13330 [Rummeliibacillus sp. POC4]
MNKEFYFCYSGHLSKFLQSKGIRYITKAITPNTNQMFTLFKVTDELSQALIEYKPIKEARIAAEIAQ